MKKVLIKLISILLIVVCVLSITNGVGATSDIIKKSFNGSSDAEGATAVKQIISGILSVVRTVGAVIAVIMLMTIGAKYIVASAGDRADIKKYAINYVIGAVVLLGATGILSVIKNLVDESLS